MQPFSHTIGCPSHSPRAVTLGITLGLDESGTQLRVEVAEFCAGCHATKTYTRDSWRASTSLRSISRSLPVWFATYLHRQRTLDQERGLIAPGEAG